MLYYFFFLYLCGKCFRLKVAQILTGVKNDAQEMEAVRRAVRTEPSLHLFHRPGLWLDQGGKKTTKTMFALGQPGKCLIPRGGLL